VSLYRAVSEALISDPAPRILPPLTSLNRAFWTGGAQNQLLILRCAACQRWVHPPSSSCPDCEGALGPEPVSGRGVIFTFTVNDQGFNPSVPTPYVIAIVELAEQHDLRIPTNIVGCEPEQLQCGMPVRVLFEQHGEVFVPLFEPDEESR